MSDDEKWKAVCENNINWDGVFFYGIKTTGIFCRPSCKSKLPLRKNVVYFDSAAAAQELLLENDDAVLSVAISAGFESTSSFYRNFVKETGMPPAAYRKAYGKISI